jgi:hypothetical protein
VRAIYDDVEQNIATQFAKYCYTICKILLHNLQNIATQLAKYCYTVLQNIATQLYCYTIWKVLLHNVQNTATQCAKYCHTICKILLHSFAKYCHTTVSSEPPQDTRYKIQDWFIAK